MRLDKYLALSGERSRTEAARAIRSGLVYVNGVCLKNPAIHIAPQDVVTLSGTAIVNKEHSYYMLHKPAGVLTAARDSRAKTVMDLLPEALAKRDVLPVGRLDKDTTGLLLLTNDGALAHRLLSPKSHVSKRYEATVSGTLTAADVDAFKKGLALSDFTALPAKLTIVEAGENESRAVVEISEGKFHQIKRMFLATGHEVVKLHRASFGSLTLPSDLPEGDYRELTQAELDALKACPGAKAQREGGEGNA